MDKFQSDLAKGENFEQRTVDYLNGLNTKCVYRKIEGYHPPYDLICDHCGTTIECKSEYKGVLTGNFYFERAGLLNKCKAKWLYHEIPYPDNPRVYVSSWRELKSLLRQFHADGLPFTPGSDGNKQEGLVVPIDMLRSIWHIEYYEQSGGQIYIFG